MLQVFERARVGVRPAIEMLFDVRRDSAELGFLTAGGDENLVIIEKLRHTFAARSALLAVAHHLVNGFGNRFFGFRRFAFDDGEGQAVEKKNNVRVDVLLRAAYAELELRYSDEGIVFRLIEVNVKDVGATLSRPSVLVNARAFEQETQNLPVILDEIARRKTVEATDDFINLRVGHPVVDFKERVAQHGQHHDFGEGFAVAFRRLLLVVEPDDLPAETFKLREERLFDVILFVNF